jgi:hypothetical protein
LIPPVAHNPPGEPPRCGGGAARDRWRLMPYIAGEQTAVQGNLKLQLPLKRPR